MSGIGAQPRVRVQVVAVVAFLVLLVSVLFVVRGDGADGTNRAQTAGTSRELATAQRNPDSTSLPTQLAPDPGRPPASKRAGLGERVSVGDGVTVRLNKIEAVRGVARGLGEVAGPALRVTITLSNESSSPLDLELALANAYVGPDRAPAIALSGPGAGPFPAEVAPGSTASGVFVFAVPPDQRDNLVVEFSYSTEAPRVVFSGAVTG